MDTPLVQMTQWQFYRRVYTVAIGVVLWRLIKTAAVLGYIRAVLATVSTIWMGGSLWWVSWLVFVALLGMVERESEAVWRSQMDKRDLEIKYLERIHGQGNPLHAKGRG